MIHCADLDGANQRTIARLSIHPDYKDEPSLALDVKANRIYYIDTTGYPISLSHIDLNNANFSRETLLSFHWSTPNKIAIDDQYVYLYIEKRNGHVYRTNKNRSYERLEHVARDDRLENVVGPFWLETFGAMVVQKGNTTQILSKFNVISTTYTAGIYCMSV